MLSTSKIIKKNIKKGIDNIKNTIYDIDNIKNDIETKSKGGTQNDN